MNGSRLLPGLLTLCLGAILARALAASLGFSHLLLAIALGFVATNTVGVPDRLEPGIATHKLWLGGGIVLMGASISLETVLEVGGPVLLLVVGVTTTTLLTVDRKSTRLNSSHCALSRMPSSA